MTPFPVGTDPLHGDLLFFEGTMPHSRLIEGWTHSCYSHVAVLAQLKVGPPGDVTGHRWAVIEAIESLGGGRVQVRPLDRYLEECGRQGCHVDWYRIDIPGMWRQTSSQRERIVDFCFRQWDLPYVSLVQMAWSFFRLNKWIRSVFGLPVDLDPERWFCSKLVEAAFFSAGLAQPGDLDPSETSPGALLNFPFVHFGARLV